MRRLAALTVAAVLLITLLFCPIDAAAEGSADGRLVIDLTSGITLRVPGEWESKGETIVDRSTSGIGLTYRCTLDGVGSDCYILLGSEYLARKVPDASDSTLQIYTVEKFVSTVSSLDDMPYETYTSSTGGRFLMFQRTDTITECYSVKNKIVYLLVFQLDSEKLTAEQRSEIVRTTLKSAMLLAPVLSTESVTAYKPGSNTVSSSSSSSSSGSLPWYFILFIIAVVILAVLAANASKKEMEKRKAQEQHTDKPFFPPEPGRSSTPAPTPAASKPASPQPAAPKPTAPKPGIRLEKDELAEKGSLVLMQRDCGADLPEADTLLELSLDVVADEAQASYSYVVEDPQLGRFVANDTVIIPQPLITPFTPQYVTEYLEKLFPLEGPDWQAIRDDARVEAWCKFVEKVFYGQ